MKEYLEYEISDYHIVIEYKDKEHLCFLEVPFEMLSEWIEKHQKTTRYRDTYKGGIPDEEYYEISEKQYIEQEFYKSEQIEFFNSLIDG